MYCTGIHALFAPNPFMICLEYGHILIRRYSLSFQYLLFSLMHRCAFLSKNPSKYVYLFDKHNRLRPLRCLKHTKTNWYFFPLSNGSNVYIWYTGYSWTLKWWSSILHFWIYRFGYCAMIAAPIVRFHSILLLTNALVAVLIIRARRKVPRLTVDWDDELCLTLSFSTFLSMA